MGAIHVDGHKMGDHGRLREHIMSYIIYDNNHQDFASSRFRVNKKVGGTRSREGAKGDSSMNVEEVSSVALE